MLQEEEKVVCSRWPDICILPQTRQFIASVLCIVDSKVVVKPKYFFYYLLFRYKEMQINATDVSLFSVYFCADNVGLDSDMKCLFLEREMPYGKS